MFTNSYKFTLSFGSAAKIPIRAKRLAAGNKRNEKVNPTSCITSSNAVYPKSEIQRCIVHQIRSSLKFVSWKDRKAVAKDLKSVYSADNEEDAQLALTDFNNIWGKKYSNITASWLTHWEELATFF